MANSADPDQLASSEANWSGSTLFAKAGYIQVQQDKGKVRQLSYWQTAANRSNFHNILYLPYLLEPSIFGPTGLSKHYRPRSDAKDAASDQGLHCLSPIQQFFRHINR